MILGLATNVPKLLEKVPEIPTLIAAVLGLPKAFSTLGVVLPLVTGGITSMSVALLASPIGLTIAAIVACWLSWAALKCGSRSSQTG